MRIVLEDGSFTFAKMLIGEVTFLDLHQPEPTPSLERLASAPVLFRIWVDNRAVGGRKLGWPVIDHAPLSESEAISSAFRMRDAISGQYRIYRENLDSPETWTETSCAPEACAHQEAAAIWSREHAESRLNDHYAGRENPIVRSLAV